jgi:hypothetical protein
VRLLERAFEDCSRVVVTKLHGGFSGSLVLKTDSYGPNGSRDEPTVTKLDDAVSMLEEVAKTARFTELVGASAAKVQRGPFLVDASGERIEAAASSTKEDHGCVVLDMAGACWVMPEFYGKLDTELISTFKQHVVWQLAVEPSLEISIDVMAVMQELWGAGGPLRALALETCKRSDTLATAQPKGLLGGALRGIITSLILAFRAPNDAKPQGTDLRYEAPLLLDGCISKALESNPGWLKEDWFSKIDGLQAKKFEHSLVHDCEAAVWRDEGTCKALVGLIEQLQSLLQPGDPTWLANYKPLRMHQHGDLNCGNILVDVRNSLWLIDFAKAGEQALFVDAAKMVSVILFEQFPVPLTLEDLGRTGGPQKLVDALGASKEEADALVSLAAACSSKAALLERVAANGSHQRFLPFIDDNAVAEQRAKEACDVIDLLFKPNTDGQQPQLWEMGECQPPAEWPTYARLALQLCARVLKVTTELVAECSRREQGNGEAVKEDLHPIQFLLPLLKRALSTLRYRDCGSWQKRVAWYAAQRLAEALTPLLRQPAQPLPASADRVLATELRLVAGQPIAMLGAAGRLDGGLGRQRRLFLASADDGPLAQCLISDETEPLRFDQVDQTVLPWQVPSPETVDAVLQAARQDLATTVPALNALVETIPSLKMLSKERAQGANGAAVSKLIERLHRVTPKAQALQDRVEKQVRVVCSDTSTTVDQLWSNLDQVFTLGTLQETVEALAIDQLTNLGGLRIRSYAVGQRLLVHQNGAWLEQAVTHSARGSAQHQFEGNGDQLSITLHPWNHAPLDLPLASFEALRVRHASTLRTQHASIVDALSGQRLDIFDQCVPIKVVTKAEHTLTNLKNMTEKSQGEEAEEKLSEEISTRVNKLAKLRRMLKKIRLPCSGRKEMVARRLEENVEAAVAEENVEAAVEEESEEEEPEKASSTLAKVNEVGALTLWLLAAHAARRDSADAGPAACLLLTAPPAAGKTCLMSQLVMHVLQSEACDLVPILIKVQELQRHLLNESNRTIFERSWNWVDAFLQCVHGAGSDLYCMLRQALMARRALVLLDGIDEGGKAREKIERHVTEVLAPQGHVMLVTSRPAGLESERFRQHFVRVQLEPLTEEQQKEVVVKRLGEGDHSDLLEYLSNPERVPLDNETKQRVTGNPLMLSMVISIFQSKQGTDSAMPATITELYETASKAMLERVDRKERGAAASTAAVPNLISLLEATFFEAHASEVRDFGEVQLNRAALALFAPDHFEELLLKELKGRELELELEKGKRWESGYIKVGKVQGSSFGVGKIVQYQGEEMVVSKAEDRNGYLKLEKSLLPLERELEQLRHVACAALPAVAEEALRAVRERVAQDRLPLLSLLEAEPLLMRSSHLSFQEYFTARAICTGKHRLPRDSPPWKWGPFWANVVKLGCENGTTFGSGLLLTAGVEGDELNLSKQLGGDRPTVLAVVCALMGSLRVLDLADNKLGPEGGAALVEGLKGNSRLTELE